MDLFDAIDKLFRKEEIEDPPSGFILHRFLASKSEYAPFCKEINLHVQNRRLAWKLWQTMLPEAPRAPYFPYAAPKKQKIDSPFIKGLMDRMNIEIMEALEIEELLSLSGKKEETAAYFGIEI